MANRDIFLWLGWSSKNMCILSCLRDNLSPWFAWFWASGILKPSSKTCKFSLLANLQCMQVTNVVMRCVLIFHETIKICKSVNKTVGVNNHVPSNHLSPGSLVKLLRSKIYHYKPKWSVENDYGCYLSKVPLVKNYLSFNFAVSLHVQVEMIWCIETATVGLELAALCAVESLLFS